MAQSSIWRKQKTVKGPVSFSGIGVHTGCSVTLTFLPAKEGTGLVFERIDLPGKPRIPASIEYVVDTARSTNLGLGSVRVNTVEHVLAALYAAEIDNAILQISAGETPIGDGSSLPFVKMIEEAGVLQQEAQKPIFQITEPLYYSQGDIHLVAIPYPEYRISYTLHYPKSEALKAQYTSHGITEESFRKEIAPCRTFALYDEISHLMDRGLIRGGSLENAVVIKDDVIFSKEGLKFPDEMARHKVLDMVGDLALVGFPIQAHIVAVKSGHQANTAFAKVIYNAFSRRS